MKTTPASDGPTSELTDSPSEGDPDPIDVLLTRVGKPAPEPPAGALRVARVVALRGRSGKIAWRGSAEPVDADVADEVDLDLVSRTMADHGLVLVQGDTRLEIVGVIQTRSPSDIKWSANTIEIEAKRELLLRSGRAALRLREDGDVELIGSRIHAASRGLFKIVGRILRLN